jgi:hypothetical protein
MALARAADGLVLIVDPATLRAGQARRLVDAIESNRPRSEQRGWCGVIVNRAPPGMDGSDLAAVARDMGAAVDRIVLVALDAQGLQDARLHESVAGDRPATRFADDAMRAFDTLLADEQATWAEPARERWRALVAAKAREVARTDAQRELEAAVQRKRLDHWPRLEDEHQRLGAELDRLRAGHGEDLLRQGRQIDDLRTQVRVLRTSLEAARARASVRRTRSLAAVGLGLAGGALLALIAAVSLWRGSALDALEELPLMAGLLSAHRPEAPSSRQPGAPSAAGGGRAPPAPGHAQPERPAQGTP